jgi:transposase
VAAPSPVEAAQAAGRTHDTDLAAQYRRLATRRGKKQAVVAVGQTILVVACHLLARDRDDQELGAGWFDQHDRAAVKHRLVRRLEALAGTFSSSPTSPDPTATCQGKILFRPAY